MNTILQSFAVALATTTMFGCYMEVGTLDGETADEDTVAESPVEEESPCNYDACWWYCADAGSCAYDSTDASSVCINDCLDVCSDGFLDEKDLEVMSCVEENVGDPACLDGLLESCCERTGGFSDFCE